MKIIHEHHESNFLGKRLIDYAREHYKDLAQSYDEECWEYMSTGYITDINGNLYTTNNPDAKLDW